MTPHAEPSPYHDQRPLAHDLNYEIRDGVPVLITQEDDSP